MSTAALLTPMMREFGKRVAEAAFPHATGPLAATQAIVPVRTGGFSGTDTMAQELPAATPVIHQSYSPTPLAAINPWPVLRVWLPPIMLVGLALIGLRAGWSWAKSPMKCRTN
jgi:hypothetical protein